MEIIKHPLEGIDYVGSDNDRDTIIQKYYLIKNLDREDTLSLKSLIYKSTLEEIMKSSNYGIPSLHHINRYIYCEYIDGFRGRLSEKTDDHKGNFLSVASELDAHIFSFSVCYSNPDTLVRPFWCSTGHHTSPFIEYKYKDFIKLCKDYQK